MVLRDLVWCVDVTDKQHLASLSFDSTEGKLALGERCSAAIVGAIPKRSEFTTVSSATLKNYCSIIFSTVKNEQTNQILLENFFKKRIVTNCFFFRLLSTATRGSWMVFNWYHYCFVVCIIWYSCYNEHNIHIPTAQPHARGEVDHSGTILHHPQWYIFSCCQYLLRISQKMLENIYQMTVQ